MSTNAWLRICAASLFGLTLTSTGCTLPGGKTAFNPFGNKPAKSTTVAEAPEETAPSRLRNPGKLYLAYAKWQEQVGNVPEARESYQLALSENPKSVEAIVGLARLDQLGGRMDEAENGFKKALGMAPKDATVNQALGQFYMAQKRPAEALPFLAHAAELSPNDSGVRYQYAVALAKSGDYQGAFPHFVKAVGEAEAHYNIGYILHEAGQKGPAEKQFQVALSKKPQLRQAQVMLAKINGQPMPGTQMAQRPQQAPIQQPVQQVSNFPQQQQPQQNVPAYYQTQQPQQQNVPANYLQQQQHLPAQFPQQQQNFPAQFPQQQQNVPANSQPQFQQPAAPQVTPISYPSAQQPQQSPQQWQPTSTPVEQWPHSQSANGTLQNWQSRQ